MLTHFTVCNFLIDFQALSFLETLEGRGKNFLKNFKGAFVVVVVEVENLAEVTAFVLSVSQDGGDDGR